MNPAGNFSKEEGEILLRIARHTLEKKFDLTQGECHNYDTFLKNKKFLLERGVFVTLKTEEKLRGCIGNIESCGPIIDAVEQNALNAAFHDHRFNPLDPDELKKIRIEVSILTDPEPLEFESPEELISKLRPGIDGIILQMNGSGATFLPQVWEQLPTAREFLSHLCQKAGLARDAWTDKGLKIFTYGVEYFEE